MIFIEGAVDMLGSLIMDMLKACGIMFAVCVVFVCIILIALYKKG